MLKIAHSARTAETKLTFSLPVDHPAGAVSVVGNFNDWTPGRDRLVKRSNGQMSAAVTVASDYVAVFRYLGENGWWFDEPEADFVDEGASVVLSRREASAGSGSPVRRTAARAVAEAGEGGATTATRTRTARTATRVAAKPAAKPASGRVKSA